MRTFILLFCTTVFGLTANSSFSQTKIVIGEDQLATVNQVFRIIKKQTDYGFIFPKKMFKNTPSIQLKKGEIELEKLLEQSLRPSNLGFVVSDDLTITIREKKSEIPFEEINAIQKIQITGKITDESGTPLPGANILEKGTNNGTETDFDGNFSIGVTDNNVTLVVSYLGFVTKEVPVNDQSNITVTLKEDASKLDEIVVVGYGTQKKSNLIGAVASVKGEDLITGAATQVTDVLAGKIAGVTFDRASGAPGAGSVIRVRGVGTLNNNNPLILVDGLPGSMNDVNPSDISSVEVLKDASSASIYGTRAANGVIIITTKKGSDGPVQFNFNTSSGFESLTRKLPLMNAQEFAEWTNRNRAEIGLEPFDRHLDPASLGQGTDWQDEMFNTAYFQDYNLSVSGGSENSKFNIFLGYTDQEGTMRNTSFQRYNTKISSEFKRGKFTLGETIIFNYTTNNNQNSQDAAIQTRALDAWPTLPVFDENNVGGYAGYGAGEPVRRNPRAVQDLQTNKGTRDYLFSSIYAQLEVLPNLKLKTNPGLTIINNRGLWHIPVMDLVNISYDEAIVNESSSRNFNWIIENTLTYNNEFGKHDVGFLLGHTAQDNLFKSLSGQSSGFPSNDIQIASVGANNIVVGGSENSNSLLSYFGRINYSYANKYLFEATMRRDGSSRFGSENRWATFPSVSVGWRISEENFLKNSTFINSLKLRANWGQLGNQSINDYITQSIITPNSNYLFGIDENLTFGSTSRSFATKDIRWETTTALNFGIDALIKNTLEVSLEYYNNTTEDILVNVPIPNSTGTTSDPVVNLGEVDNFGVDATLGYRNKVGDFSYNLSGVFGWNGNEVKKLGEEDKIIWAGGVTRTTVGSEVGEYYLLQADGLFQSEDEVNNHVYTDPDTGTTSLLQPNAVPGDVRFIDTNNDGELNSDDRVYSGSSNPNFSFGLNINLGYKGFDFSAVLKGAAGGHIYSNFINFFESNNSSAVPANQFRTRLNSWTPENPTNIPRSTFNDANNNSRASSLWLFDGDYLKIRNVQLGYSLPKNSTEKLNINTLRFYVSGQNLFTFTKYEGFDPEVPGNGLTTRGIDGFSYPRSRVMTLGAQLTF